MLNRLQLLRNIGQFNNVSTPATLALRRLTLIYAENGRGKTTLAAILRSLASGEALPITERRRLGATHPPEVIIASVGAAQPAAFQNGAWSRTCPEVLVFDDAFVNRNVYSGLDVAAEHRQNLHELILGAQGVTLARQVDDLATQIRNHSTEIRNKSAAIPASERHGLTVDEFCALPEQPNVDTAITEAEQRLLALRQASTVQSTAGFSSLALPSIESNLVSNLLGQTVVNLDASAVNAVRNHFVSLGDGAEGWLAAGMNYVPGGVNATAEANCPFCQHELLGSQAFTHYRAYFEESADLLGFWQTDFQPKLLSSASRDIKLAPLSSLEPYLHGSPWSAALEGRRVLVVHPFASTIRSQYVSNRLNLFDNQQVLPAFNLQVLEPPQTLAPLTAGYPTWLDALNGLTQRVLQCDFDIALLGCGAYGLPLGASIKAAGRQAIHLGGALQVLFGIRGRRWENIPSIAVLMNGSWVRPSDQETPVSASRVDEGCYW